MKLGRSRLAVALLALGAATCGSPSPMFEVKIIRRTIQYPLQTLKQNGGKIYFNFIKLKSAHLTDEAVPRQVIVYPERFGDSFDPQADSFDVGGAPLEKNTWYKVVMYGATPQSEVGNPPYISIPSCAWNTTLENGVILCFGVKSDVEAEGKCPPPTPCPTG